ncbi:MAG: prephenate dehydrogenase [Candidatus Sumerlaeia bacterium]|nr:prephenate dehydrogenase [Candidatus Sumerlaeia bacterium]
MTTQATSDAGFATVDTLVVVGLGLIGGAVARAARGRGLVRRIVAVGRRAADMDAAVAAGVVDEWTADLSAAAARGDVVVLARPVEIIVEDARVALRHAPVHALVTDAGSTKGAIVSAAEAAQQPGGARFVGSHPMAGSDKTGWRASPPDLFRGATTIVTPTDNTDPASTARAAAFWRALGSRIVLCTPQRHDDLIGLVSHLPHMVAAGLAEELAEHRADVELLRLLAGPGLRDTTRVAAGDPDLWCQICHQNPDGIADRLDRTGERLRQLADLIRRRDESTLRARLEAARSMRQALDPNGDQNWK